MNVMIKWRVSYSHVGLFQISIQVLQGHSHNLFFFWGGGLLEIINGKWIWSLQVMESLEAKKWLPEEGYEVTDWFPSAQVNQENLS